MSESRDEGMPLHMTDPLWKEAHEAAKPDPFNRPVPDFSDHVRFLLRRAVAGYAEAIQHEYDFRVIHEDAVRNRDRHRQKVETILAGLQKLEGGA